MTQPYQPPLPPSPGKLPQSSLATGAFAVAVVAFVLGIIPFVGFLGIIGVVLAAVDLHGARRPDRPPRRHTFSVVAIVLGSLSTLGGVVWVILFVWLSQAPSSGSCPRVYAFDGDGYRIDADLVSGAIYAGVERKDHDRLESLRAVDGEYRLRVQNDLEEVDHVNSLALLVVDHPADVEVLPSQSGELHAVRDAAAPLRAVDAAGRDVLPLLADLDGRWVSASESRDAEQGEARREVWTLEFPRVAGNQALLVVRGHNTFFAEDAFVRHMATMGQGVGPLMAWAMSEDCPCNRDYVADEIDRLGLPLWIQVSTDGAWLAAPSLEPVGPAVLRSQALPIELPPGGDRVRIRIEATPRFWQVDQIQLAPAPAAPIAAQVLRPRSALLSTGGVERDVADVLAERDDRRLVLTTGEHVDVRFVAPPAPHDAVRTVVVSLGGYYELAIGGAPGIDVGTVLAHRLGLTSLPDFAVSLPR